MLWCWESPHIIRHDSGLAKLKWSLVERSGNISQVCNSRSHQFFVSDGFYYPSHCTSPLPNECLAFQNADSPNSDSSPVFCIRFSTFLEHPIKGLPGLSTTLFLISSELIAPYIQHEKSLAQIWHPLKTVSGRPQFCLYLHPPIWKLTWLFQTSWTKYHGGKIS